MDLEADELAFTACYFASLEIAFAPLHQVNHSPRQGREGSKETQSNSEKRTLFYSRFALVSTCPLLFLPGCPRLLIGEFLSFANYEPGTGGRFITCLDGAAFVGLDRSRVSVRSLLAVQPNQRAPIKDM